MALCSFSTRCLWSSRGLGAGPRGIWGPSRKDAGCSGLGRSAACIAPAPGLPGLRAAVSPTHSRSPLCWGRHHSPLPSSGRTRLGLVPRASRWAAGMTGPGGKGGQEAPCLRHLMVLCRHHHCPVPEHSHPIKTPRARSQARPQPLAAASLLCVRGFACPALSPWICVSWAFPVSAVTQPVAFPVELLSLRSVAVCP